MKKRLLVAVAVLLWAVPCFAAEIVVVVPKGKVITITGDMSCTFCTMLTGKMCASRECCQECVKAGDPVTLHGPKGQLYILLSNQQRKPLMTPERMDLLGSKVKVTGKMIKRGGIQGIYVESMEKAQ